MLYALVALAVVLAIVRAVIEKRGAMRTAISWAHHAETGVITLLLATLVFVGVGQIVLRNVFSSGILWAEPLMRHAVLWLGCLAGALATRTHRHIAIDALSRLIPSQQQGIRDRAIFLATAVIAALLFVATARLVMDERAFGDTVFWGLKSWHVQIVLPISFFLITYRSAKAVFLGREPEAEA